MNRRMLKAGFCIVLPFIILLFPPPEGLSQTAWQLFAVYFAAIVGLILRPFDEAVILFIVIAVSGLAFGNIRNLLGGYSSTTTWLVFSAFMIGTAFVTSGLGRRIAYILIGKMGSTTLRLGYVAALTDLIIAPATPSNTARTGGILFPIFQSVNVALGSTPGPTSRRVGGYLIMVLYYISFTTGYTFLTAMAPNALILSFGQSVLKVNVDWMMWAKAAIVPGLATLAIIPYAVYKLYPPELKEIDNKKVAAEGLAELGPISAKEKTLAVLFILAVAGWALGTVLKIDATAIAVGFVAACLFTGVITWDNVLAVKGAWSTLIWYGGIIGLADALSKAKFFEWLAKLISANVSFTGTSELAVMAILVLCCLLVRYLFASMAAFVATMIPVFFTIGLVAQVPLLPFIFLIAFACGYGGMLTHYGGALSPVLFGAGYVSQGTWWRLGAVMALISFIMNFAVSIPYWKILGIW